MLSGRKQENSYLDDGEALVDEAAIGDEAVDVDGDAKSLIEFTSPSTIA